jgi:acetyl esterase
MGTVSQPSLDRAAGLVVAHTSRTLSVEHDSSPERVRDEYWAMTAWLREPAPAGTDVRSSDGTVDGPAGAVPIRTYLPLKGSVDDVVVYLHGGGWVVGGLDSADATSRTLCSVVGATVVSVEYRLAPEHPFPAPLEDCLAVVRHVAASRPRWLGVAGDSAGGNLATGVANELVDLIDGQLLLYPALDPRRSTASYRAFAEGYLLTAAAMEYYWDCYTAPEQRDDPRAAPMLRRDLSASPAAIVATAGFDPLRDEGQSYAARLVAAGVPTCYLPAPTLPHGWADMTDRVPAAARALVAAASAFAGLRDRAVGET